MGGRTQIVGDLLKRLSLSALAPRQSRAGNAAIRPCTYACFAVRGTG